MGHDVSHVWHLHLVGVVSWQRCRVLDREVLSLGYQMAHPPINRSAPRRALDGERCAKWRATPGRLCYGRATSPGWLT